MRPYWFCCVVADTYWFSFSTNRFFFRLLRIALCLASFCLYFPFIRLSSSLPSCECVLALCRTFGYSIQLLMCLCIVFWVKFNADPKFDFIPQKSNVLRSVVSIFIRAHTGSCFFFFLPWIHLRSLIQRFCPFRYISGVLHIQ